MSIFYFSNGQWVIACDLETARLNSGNKSDLSAQFKLK